MLEAAQAAGLALEAFAAQVADLILDVTERVRDAGHAHQPLPVQPLGRKIHRRPTNFLPTTAKFCGMMNIGDAL